MRLAKAGARTLVVSERYGFAGGAATTCWCCGLLRNYPNRPDAFAVVGGVAVRCCDGLFSQSMGVAADPLRLKRTGSWMVSR